MPMPKKRSRITRTRVMARMGVAKIWIHAVE
jgi:hypothetical protein